MKGFQGAPIDEFQKKLATTEKKDVPLLFGVGAAWGGWIANTTDSVEAMADLPWVEALMERVLQLDPEYYYGGPHLFKAILLSTRPEQFGGNLKRAAVELAKDWRSDRVLRRLEAMMIVADRDASLLITGSGDVIEPDDGLVAIGSGGNFALAAARALVKHSSLAAREIAEEAMVSRADI